MSSAIDVIRAANRQETRRVRVDLPAGEETVAFYIAAKDTYAIWSDQREALVAEKKRLDGYGDEAAVLEMASTAVASKLLRVIIPRYFRNEDGSPAYKDEAELQEITDLISSDGAALGAVTDAWTRLSTTVSQAGKKAKN